MRANVFLVKHGEAIISNLKVSHSVPNEDQNILSEAGTMQMKQVATEFTKLKRKITIYSSPSPRVTASAEILSNVLGVNYEVTDLLGDRLQSTEGFTNEQYRESQNFAALHPYSPTIGGESFLEQKSRILSWFVSFINNLKVDEDYILVTHGSTIEHLQSFLLNLPLNASEYFFSDCYPGRFHHWIGHKMQNSKIIWELVTSNSSNILEDLHSKNNLDEVNSWKLEDYIPPIITSEIGNQVLLQKDLTSSEGSGTYHR
jgi:broad specificity phosphatase PhoE